MTSLLPLELAFHILIFFMPLFFGSVHTWAWMSFAGFLFLILFFHPSSVFKIQELPHFFWRGMTLLFLIIVAQSLFFSALPHETRFELLKWLAFSAGFLCLQLLPLPALYRLLISFVVMGLFQSIYGFLQVKTGSEMVLWRVKEAHLGFITGTYLNRNHCAGLLEMSLGVNLGVLLFEWHRRRYLSVLALASFFLIEITGLMLTGSRMGIASWFTVSLFYLFLLVRKQRPDKFLPFTFFIFALMVAAIYLGKNSLWQRFGEPASELFQFSHTERLVLWQSVVKMVIDFPLFGIGLGTFGWIFPSYQPERLIWGYSHAHNDYLEWASELGVPAFMMMILTFGFLILYMLRHFASIQKRAYVLIGGVLAAILSLCLHGVTDFNFAIPANAALFIFLLGINTRMIYLLKETDHEI